MLPLFAPSYCVQILCSQLCALSAIITPPCLSLEIKSGANLYRRKVFSPKNSFVYIDIIFSTCDSYAQTSDIIRVSCLQLRNIDSVHTSVCVHI